MPDDRIVTIQRELRDIHGKRTLARRMIIEGAALERDGMALEAACDDKIRGLIDILAIARHGLTAPAPAPPHDPFPDAHAAV